MKNESLIDRDWLDGDQVQSALVGGADIDAARTQISLIARATDGFVVVQGNDRDRPNFSDANISAIFVTFANTVTANPTADAATLRTAALAALAGQWTADSTMGDSPFDETVEAPARMIFHIQVPGWGFEPARIKFKDEVPPDEFTGLEWLTLNGAPCQPYSFEIWAQAANPGEYEYSLFIKASQDAGNQSTRVIIDPKIKVIPN